MYFIYRIFMDCTVKKIVINKNIKQYEAVKNIRLKELAKVRLATSNLLDSMVRDKA